MTVVLSVSVRQERLTKGIIRNAIRQDIEAT